MKKSAIAAVALVLVSLVGWRVYESRQAPIPAAPVSRVPKGPAPALPPGFPPTFPGSTLDSNKTEAVEGGWQRIFAYTAKGKAPDILGFYRKELRSAGLELMAEGAGSYGAMLRAQDKSGKRAVSVDIDAPEDSPKQAPSIKIVVFDTP